MPVPNDSEPGPSPSLPEHAALWNDVDMRGMRASSATISEPHDAKPDDPPGNGPAPTIGHIGRYALKHQLGEGGIGTVFAAHDPLLSRLIAVKTLHVEVIEAERESFNALFLNEARAAAGLNHPNIVTVFDAGISDDRAYIAMELLKGRDLRQLRQEGWRATPAQAALIVRRVADALGYAHSKGVVHRDVKPANIFMIGRTQPKVLDFGIARIAHQHEAQQTGEVAAGSPYYMAPEQARQEPVDRRADVFSLGVVLYELLTDLKPFRGNTLDEIMAAVLKHDPPLANLIDAAVPEALAQIAAKALAKNPEQRYRSARAFSRELRHWLDENTVSSDGDGRAAAPGRAAPLWLAAGAAGVVVLGVIAWTTLGSQRAAAPPTAAPELVAVSATLAEPVAPIAAPLPPSAGVIPDHVMTPAPDPASAALAPPKPAVASKPLNSAPNAARDEVSKGARSRETRERTARTAAATAAAAAPVPTGVLRVAISPWGEVEVDGRRVGTSPPLNEFSLPAGRHQVVVRNTDLPPHSVTVNVSADQPVTVKHKF